MLTLLLLHRLWCCQYVSVQTDVNKDEAPGVSDVATAPFLWNDLTSRINTVRHTLKYTLIQHILWFWFLVLPLPCFNPVISLVLHIFTSHREYVCGPTLNPTTKTHWLAPCLSPNNLLFVVACVHLYPTQEPYAYPTWAMQTNKNKEYIVITGSLWFTGFQKRASTESLVAPVTLVVYSFTKRPWFTNLF